MPENWCTEAKKSCCGTTAAAASGTDIGVVLLLLLTGAAPASEERPGSSGCGTGLAAAPPLGESSDDIGEIPRPVDPEAAAPAAAAEAAAAARAAGRKRSTLDASTAGSATSGSDAAEVARAEADDEPHELLPTSDDDVGDALRRRPSPARALATDAECSDDAPPPMDALMELRLRALTLPPSSLPATTSRLSQGTRVHGVTTPPPLKSAAPLLPSPPPSHRRAPGVCAKR
jgi:hypothetical protein